MHDVPFHNPYNFIPAPDRGAGGARLPEGLRDAEPAGHHRWHDSLWSGDIAITIRTVTPLLITRERQVDGEQTEHRHLEIATVTGADGVERVDLAPTQLKGMLRSAYEAVTCSRFGVFEQPLPFGYRSEVSSAARLRPALVKSATEVEVLGELWGIDGRQYPSVTVAAWDEVGDGREWRLDDLAHGDDVEAIVVLDVFENRGRTVRRWRAEKVRRTGAEWIQCADFSGGVQYRVQGWLHATGPTIKGKRAERIFVTDVPDGKGELQQSRHSTIDSPAACGLVDELVKLAEHQRGLHQSADGDEIWKRVKDHATGRPWEYLGDDPGSTAWARHLYNTIEVGDAPSWTGRDFRIPATATEPPLTCWAELTGSRLRPVMVSRLLYEHGPVEVLADSVWPATRLAGLSPADRIFGWVTQSSVRRVEGAHRGQLRIVEVETPTARSAVQRLSPLTIEPLSSPKPSQGRFYLGRPKPDGMPQPLSAEVRRDEFFQDGQVLRGRKVYPHQQRMVGKNVDELRTMLRYQPPNDRPPRDSQNATLHQWIKPGVEFTAALRVDNLNDLELGALLWLLDPNRLGRPDQPGRLKLGGGKPLGFGSVEVTVDVARTRLSTGQQIATRLRALASTADTTDWSVLAEQFEQAMIPRFAEVLDAVRLSSVGFSEAYDVHYPRPYRRAPGYEWFVLNEKEVPKRNAKSLPLLGGDPLPERPDQR